MTTDYAQASDTTLAIEAAFESMDVKKDVFANLSAALPHTAILATNTSYLDVDEIAATVSDPSRVVGLHFFAPAHIMKLLEIIRGQNTGDVALATGLPWPILRLKYPISPTARGQSTAPMRSVNALCWR